MDAKRLLRLAKLLRSVPRKRFDMTIWANGVLCGRPNETKRRCSTSACALGWATTIPSFNKAGLRQTVATGSEELQICYRDYSGYSAATAFFLITHVAAYWLFSPVDCLAKLSREQEAPQQTADRIEQFVKSGVVPE